MAVGTDDRRRTPALVFCFDREICWSTAEVLKGKDLFAEGQRKALLDRLDEFDFSVGGGNKLRPLLARGVGVHHAGLLPRYRRVVETLFQEKLLPFCVCTETLAAGLNLPARSVVLSTLVKGPKDKKRLIDTGGAQQMFGRAGRPQFDTEGHVYAVAHEDDVKIAKWKAKFDQIPEDTKDPGLMAARKSLKKKEPKRRSGVTYWNVEQFMKLQTAPPAKLASRGNLTWRWLGFLLEADPAVEPIRAVIRRRLMDPPTIEGELKRLTKMLVTLHVMGIVVLDPPPPASWTGTKAEPAAAAPVPDDSEDEPATGDVLGKLTLGGGVSAQPISTAKVAPVAPTLEPYDPITATPTPRLRDMMIFRAVQPLYGLWLMDHLGQAEPHELVQVLESLLAMPGSVARSVRVPWPDELPPGKLAIETIDPAILTTGLYSAEDLYPPADQSDLPPEMRRYPIPLAQKTRMLFESQVDHAGGLFTTPVWAVGDLLNYNGDFDKFVRGRDLTKQEGILFKHCLRMILLCGEFERLTPTGLDPTAWVAQLTAIADVLTTACRSVDPQSTDETLAEADEEIEAF